MQSQSTLEQHQRDSLLALLQQDLTDSSRCNTLSALSMYYAKIDKNAAIKYGRQMIAFADELAEPALQGKAWKNIGTLFFKIKERDSIGYAMNKAIDYYNQCGAEWCADERFEAILSLSKSLHEQSRHRKSLLILEKKLNLTTLSKKQLAEVHYEKGCAYTELGDYDQALKNLNLTREYSREISDLKQESRGLSMLSIVYRYLGEIERAMQVNREGLIISSKLGDKTGVNHLLSGLAHSHLYLGQNDSVQYYYQKLLANNKDDETAEYYGYALSGLLGLAIEENMALADTYVQEIMALLARDIKYSQLHVKRNFYADLSRYYLKKKDYALAQKYAHQHLDHVQVSQQDTSELVVYALQELGQIQAGAGNYKAAWETYDKYHRLRMAMVQRNQQTATAQAAIKMDLAENELARQKAEQKILLEQQTSAARSRFFIFLLIMTGLILASVVWAYRLVQRDKKLISEKKQLVEQSLAEKEVLLREIHHRVKNNLQIISSLLDKQARKSSDDAVRKLVKEGQERIQSMALIHQNLYESEQLSGIDIKTYLQELSTNIQKSQAITADQIQLELNVASEKLDIDTAIPVGLILNELLTNSYKHAFTKNGCGKIRVDFKKQDDEYFLQVSDDGVGFSSENIVTKHKSLGLSLVNGLVRQLEGNIEWLKVNKGVAVAIRF